jgi:hypothetical protein
MMKLYISGPMTGLPEFNFPAFMAAAKELRKRGHQVCNPAEKNEEGNPDMQWIDYMRLDIKMLMDCDGVACLPGWENSRGAKIEVDLARSLGFPVLPYVKWL